MLLLKNILLLLFLLTGTAFAADYYVAPQGKDTNPGTLKAPFRTLAKATTVLQPGDTCYLRKGTYRETLRPTTSGEPGAPITFTNYNDEVPVLSGCQLLTGWKPYKEGIFQAPMDWSLGKNNLLFAAGKPLQEARWPNDLDNDPITPDTAAITSGDAIATSITCATLPATFTAADLEGAVVWGLCDRKWSSWTRPLLTYDAESKKLTLPSFEGSWWLKAKHAPKKGGRFYLVGKLALLDKPGEWFCDDEAKTVYYKPPAGTFPERVEAKARLNGIDLQGKKWINVRGVVLRGCSADLSDAQHCELKKIKAYYLSHTRGGSTASNLNEKTGIQITGSHNTLRDSVIAFSAGNGVMLGGQNNALVNCYVHHCNYLGAYAWPVGVDGRRNLVSHCTITRAGRDTLKVTGVEHLIEYNNISHPGRICHDLGVIYTGGNAGGNTQIRYNWLHHARNPLDIGLYFDNYAKNYIAHHNVIWEVGTGVRLNRPTGFILLANNTVRGKFNNAWGPWKGTKTQWGCAMFNNLTEQEMQMNPEVFCAGNLVDASAVRSGFGPPPQSVKFPTVSRDKIIDCGVPLATITAKKCDIGAYQHGDEKPWRPGHNFDNAPDPKYEPPTTPLRNLIINSGFDYASIYAKLGEGKENPAPWKLLGNAKIEHHKGFNSPPADGRNSILAHSATLAATGDGVEQTFSGLVAETKYHCSGYVRHEADTDVAFTILDTSGETIASASSRADGRLGGGWRFVQFSFHTGENQETATLRIVNQGTGTAYLDETGVMQERGFGSP